MGIAWILKIELQFFDKFVGFMNRVFTELLKVI